GRRHSRRYARRGWRKGRDGAQRGVLAEDRLLHLSERDARLEPELLVETITERAVCRQRLRLTSGAVERDHQLRLQTLFQGMPRDERPELGQRVFVSSEREHRLDARRECLQA